MIKRVDIKILNYAKELYLLKDIDDKILYLCIKQNDIKYMVKLYDEDIESLMEGLTKVWTQHMEVRTVLEDESYIVTSYVEYKSRRLCKLEVYKYIGHDKMDAEYYVNKVTLDIEQSRYLYKVLRDYLKLIMEE